MLAACQVTLQSNKSKPIMTINLGGNGERTEARWELLISHLLGLLELLIKQTLMREKTRGRLEEKGVVCVCVYECELAEVCQGECMFVSLCESLCIYKSLFYVCMSVLGVFVSVVCVCVCVCVSVVSAMGTPAA